MRLNPLNFTGSKIREYSQGFINDMEKILRGMNVIDVQGIEFIVYQLKEIYQWYEKWEHLRDNEVVQAM